MKKKLRDIVELPGSIEKYINSKKTLKFTIGIEVPIAKLDLEQSLKRKEDNDYLDRGEKKSRYDRKESRGSKGVFVNGKCSSFLEKVS